MIDGDAYAQVVRADLKLALLVDAFPIVAPWVGAARAAIAPLLDRPALGAPDDPGGALDAASIGRDDGHRILIAFRGAMFALGDATRLERESASEEAVRELVRRCEFAHALLHVAIVEPILAQHPRLSHVAPWAIVRRALNDGPGQRLVRRSR
ncbi:hypothetical protein [Sandaracinus amylolyticus]|uniref:hypothetical protein n=1 Tax=Sandaracinus amylolyticus TaxID=927083 RepID=UPI001F2E9E08|nr:hypothetical protein [Sandaracinus amylolyticus]UJR82664.1 Hypothetical protein I5071_47290 [Sandaracinus amylolyticus]